jgi:hypothetical protein
VQAGSAVLGAPLACSALNGARAALRQRVFVETSWTLVHAGSILAYSLELNGRTGSPTSSLVEDLAGRAGDAVGG